MKGEKICFRESEAYVKILGISFYIVIFTNVRNELTMIISMKQLHMKVSFSTKNYCAERYKQEPQNLFILFIPHISKCIFSTSVKDNGYKRSICNRAPDIASKFGC